MTAREFLEQYKDADLRAKRLGAEYEIERQLIDAIRSTSNIDGLPHGTGTSTPTEDKAVKLADKAAEWKIAELEAIRQRQVVFDAIDKVGGDAAAVLFERYVNLKNWTDVCVSVHWSWYKVRGLHEQGLKKISEIIK